MKTTTANSTFAVGGVSYSADSFVVTENLVLRMNICGKNTAHRKSANRYAQCWKDRSNLPLSGFIRQFFVN
jgi:hypothetical protein